jgi:hypothetical protein
LCINRIISQVFKYIKCFFIKKCKKNFIFAYFEKKFFFIYKKSRIARFTYACTLFYSGNAVKANGYLDSGNLAKKSGLPVCFLSPDIFYALVGEAVALGARAEETLCVATVNGEKSYPLYKGEAEIEGRKNEVYFTVSVNMVTREYNVLLPYGIL